MNWRYGSMTVEDQLLASPRKIHPAVINTRHPHHMLQNVVPFCLILALAAFTGCNRKVQAVNKAPALSVQLVKALQQDVPIYGDWVATLDTAEHVLVHADTSVHPDLLNSRFGYVSLSRASHEATLFTDDMTKLGPQLGTEVSKTSALEIETPSITQGLGMI